MDILATDIAFPPGVAAFFTTRRGGVSDPPYHSLNLSVNVGDDTGAVHENRMRLATHLPAEPMWLRQAHGSRVLLADEVVRDADVADAAHTSSTGVVCGLHTADCLPVLFFHEDASAVGAAHAGWRGLAAGVLQKTAAAMQAQNSSPLHAVIGPGIGGAHYVVGRDVHQALCKSEQDAAAFAPHASEDGKWHLSLARLAEARLAAAGVARVHTVELCTHEKGDLFFSARRDGGKTGRQAAVIYRTA